GHLSRRAGRLMAKNT
ncbi:bacterial Cytochrome Ubiquinol Oxidase family protein, partial [Vibrio parahaemolyticus V-223/04]